MTNIEEHGKENTFLKTRTTQTTAQTIAQTGCGSEQRSRCGRIAATVAAILTLSLFMTGCGSKDEGVSAAGGGQASSASGGTVKATPQQETAKQRAIDEGAAIQAANDPTKNNPATGGTGK